MEAIEGEYRLLDLTGRYGVGVAEAIGVLAEKPPANELRANS